MQDDKPGMNGVVASPAGRPREGFDDASRGTASWVTLFGDALHGVYNNAASVLRIFYVFPRDLVRRGDLPVPGSPISYACPVAITPLFGGRFAP